MEGPVLAAAAVVLRIDVQIVLSVEDARHYVINFPTPSGETTTSDGPVILANRANNHFYPLTDNESYYLQPPANPTAGGIGHGNEAQQTWTHKNDEYDIKIGMSFETRDLAELHLNKYARHGGSEGGNSAFSWRISSSSGTRVRKVCSVSSYKPKTSVKDEAAAKQRYIYIEGEKRVYIYIYNIEDIYRDYTLSLDIYILYIFIYV